MLAIRRRDNNKWEPPGGTLEAGETILDGLRREVKEEVGVEIMPGPLTGVYKNMQRGIVALVFRCEHTGETPNESPEVAQIKWMTQDDIRRELDPAYACRLLDGLNQQVPAIRAHDGIQLLDEPI